MSGTHQPWWNHTALYAVMVLMLLALYAHGLWQPRATRPSPLAEEQAVIKALDARLTPANVSAALLQHPLLALGLLLAGLLLLLAWVGGLVLLLRRVLARRALLTAGDPGPPRVWSLGDVARVLIAALVAAHLLPATQWLWRQLSGGPVGDLHVWMLVAMVLVDGAALLAVLALASGKRPRGTQAIGWPKHGWPLQCRHGLLTYLMLVPVLTALMVVVVRVAAWFHYTPPPEPLLGLFLNESRWPVLLIASLFIGLLGPLIEEVVFRGVLYPALRRRWNAHWSILVSGGCFAALHTNPAGLLPIWLLGGALAWLYETTGSLAPSIALHVAHNTTMIAGLWCIKALLAAIG